MNFCLDLCIYIDNSLGVLLGKFSFTSSFLVKNAKNNVFEDKWFWSKIFYQIKIQANTNWSSHPKKKTFDFFQTVYFFLHNFQKSQFSEIFENHQYHTQNSLYEINFM